MELDREDEMNFTLIKTKKSFITIIIIIVLLLIIPTFVKSGFIIHLLIMCFIWSAVASAWDLIFGYAGIFSFGQIAFFTIGAYGSAIASMKLGVSPWIGILFGGMVTCIIGLLIGIPCLRLKGLYVALVTFALHLSLPAFIYVGAPIGTGGSHSLTGIPPLKIGNYIFTPMNRVPTYYVALALSFIIIFVIYKIINSSFGMAFTALRDAKDFARNIGINEYKYKIIVFGISSLIAGIMGGFYAHYVCLISHHLVGLDLIILIMVIVVVGGLGKFPGAIISTFIFIFLNEYLRSFEQYRNLLWGGLVVITIILMPGGITEIFDNIGRIFSKVAVKVKIKTIKKS